MQRLSKLHHSVFQIFASHYRRHEKPALLNSPSSSSYYTLPKLALLPCYVILHPKEFFPKKAFSYYDV